jgi:hypothetical protein
MDASEFVNFLNGFKRIYWEEVGTTKLFVLIKKN